MSTTETIAVRLLEAADSRDARLVDHLTDLINDVYAVAESGSGATGRHERRHPRSPS